MASNNPALSYVMLALQIARTASEIGELVAAGQMTPAQAQRKLEQIGNRVAKARARWKTADAAARKRESQKESA